MNLVTFLVLTLTFLPYLYVCVGVGLRVIELWSVGGGSFLDEEKWGGDVLVVLVKNNDHLLCIRQILEHFCYFGLLVSSPSCLSLPDIHRYDTDSTKASHRVISSSISKFCQAIAGVGVMFFQQFLLPSSNSLSNSVCGNFMTQPLWEVEKNIKK